MYNNHQHQNQSDRFVVDQNRHNNDFRRQPINVVHIRTVPKIYEQAVTETMTTTINKEVNSTIDETTTVEFEKGPMRRVNFVTGPNSAFARLFPERYRQEQIDFTRNQRSKSYDDEQRYNFDRVNDSSRFSSRSIEDDLDQSPMLRRSHRVRFADEQQWKDVDGRIQSEPYLNENLARHVLNYDPDPEVIYRDNPEKLTYVQKVGVRYLKPPTPPPPGPLVIREVQQSPPAEPPPLIVAATPPETPKTPSPLIVRERPPTPPQPLPTKVITKTLPASAVPRRVIIKRVPPLPAKPRPIIIEKWLPYKNPPEREVVYERSEPKERGRAQTRNVIVQYQPARVRIEQQVQNVGCFRVDPKIYQAEFGSSLRRTDSIRRVLQEIGCNPNVLTSTGYETDRHDSYRHSKPNTTCLTDQQLAELVASSSSSSAKTQPVTTRQTYYSTVLSGI